MPTERCEELIALTLQSAKNRGYKEDFETCKKIQECCKAFTENDVKVLCERATQAFIEDGVLAMVDAPVTIVGDVHGQLYDLIELFKIGGIAPQQNMLFLGDYVDRGYYSVETVTILFALKVKFPRRVTLLRGNHETRQVTQVYGFYDECMRKFGSSKAWGFYTSAFDFLPLSAVVDNSIYCPHGGLSPHLNTLDEVRALESHCRKEVPHEGAVCDLLWSDPEDGISGFNMSPRGAGYTFGADTVQKWNHTNKLDIVCRAHQLVMDGFNWNHDQRTLTVFSAPNYCYRCGNFAGILVVGENTKVQEYDVRSFSDAPREPTSNKPTPREMPDYFI